MNCQYKLHIRRSNKNKKNMINLAMQEHFFYPKLLSFLILDSMCFSFFEQHTLSLLLCFVLLHLYQKKLNQAQASCILLCISLESFLFYGKFGIQLIYVVPIMILAIKAQKMFYASKLQPYLLLIGCLLLQNLIIEPKILKYQPGYLYTSSQIIANIIVMGCISLIFYSQGKLGNRLKGLYSLQEESPDS